MFNAQICKGNCGRYDCPICQKIKAINKVRPIVGKEDFFGKTPNIFVGRVGYPKVNIGILSPTEELEKTWITDSPKYWMRKEFSIEKIIQERTKLVNAQTKVDIKSSDRIANIAKETALSTKMTDVEINLNKKPKFNLNFEEIQTPQGSTASIKKATITENVKVKRKVEKVVGDFDLRAKDAITYLSNNGYDNYFLTKLISSANIGMKNNRKLVPTRWSITAIDDMVSQESKNSILQYSKKIDTYKVLYGENIGNYYIILLLPDIFSFELFETYLPKTIWNNNDLAVIHSDYENHNKRTEYARNCTGGYYASRISVTEKLLEEKKQGSALVLRFITDEYYAPLGVWNCRETTKKAMNSKPIEFETLSLALNYLKIFVRKKFGYNIDNILRRSLLLTDFKKQTKLNAFFK